MTNQNTPEIFFRSEEHKQRFQTTMQEIDKVDDGRFDQEYAAAIYVLTARTGIWNAVKGYVSRHGIKFDEMLDEVDFSGGYTVLMKWAANLFNEHAANINPVELMRLDESNFKIAISALYVRCYGWSLETEK